MHDLRTRPQATPLLERDRELAAIRDALESAAAGDGVLVLVEGGAGIGKSRLLDATGQLAEGEGFQVLHARSGEPERDFPFGVARQLYEPPLARAEPAIRAELLAGAVELAAPLFGDARWGRTLAADDDSLFPILHGLFWLTHNLAAEGPLLMQVDDLHWADASSLRLLLYLTRRLAGMPVVIVATTRPNEPHAQDVLKELHTLSATRVLGLQPLSEAAVASVVRSAAFPEAEESFCRACAEATGGNPFLLVELIGALAAEGVPPTAEGARAVDVTSPEAVSRHVLVRLRQLPASAVSLARAAAVAGDGGPLRHAAALAGLDPDEAVIAADALVATELLAPGDPLCFVHPVVRSAVYADLPAGERSRAHVRLARLVAGEGAPATRAAAHLLRGQRAGDGWVVETLVEAAEHALAGGAPESAVDYLRRALEEPPERSARGELLVALAEAEAASGDPQAFGRFEEALETIDDDHRAAEVLFLLGRRLYMFGKFPEAASAFDRGSKRLGGRDPDLATQLEAGYVSVARLDVSLRPVAAERLEALLARPEDRSTDMEALLLGHVAFERAIRGESRKEIVALARRALAGGHLLGAGQEEGLDAVVALAYCDELADAQDALDRSIEAARGRGSIVAYARTLHYRAWVAFRQGRLAEAMADTEAVIEHAEEVPVAGPAVEALLALALCEQGHAAQAKRVLDIEDVEERWGWSAPYVYFLDARARVAMLTGSPEAALTDLRAAGQLLSVLRATNPSLVAWRSQAALACHRLGDAAEAERLASEEVELARDFGAPRALGIALRSQGMIRGREAGLPLLRQAVDVLAEGPDRLEHARALTELGAALRRANRRVDARGPLREGFELAERCAAWALRDRAREELSAAGGRVGSAVTAGAESLTPGERRVAAMAAEGLSNREIAQALFVTVKAVEWHLSNAYRKLEIKSRRQLGEALNGPARPRSG
jgi:DNA-binding CsgD family transcriptional regulator